MITKTDKNEQLILGAGNLIPEVGMGVTRSSGSDSYPYTIVAVADDLSWIEINQDSTNPAPNFHYYNNQTYLYTSDMRTPGERIKLHIKGSRTGSYGEHLYLGHRRYYQDPSF